MIPFQANEKGFDILITGLTMPAMTGERLALEIRKIRPGLPVILCTGYSEGISEEKASGLGIDRYFIKPVSNADLAAAVNQILAGQGGKRL